MPHRSGFRWWRPLPVILVVLAAAAAREQPSDLTVDAPASLEPIARRIREIDPIPLAKALGTAGLPAPRPVRILLVAGDDPRVGRVPEWIVGFASGTEAIVIFPSRIGPYPY